MRLFFCIFLQTFQLVKIYVIPEFEIVLKFDVLRFSQNNFHVVLTNISLSHSGSNTDRRATITSGRKLSSVF